MTDHSALIELVEHRIGQDFDGECHLTEAEARELISTLRDLTEWRDMAADLMRLCTTPERFEGASTLQVYARMRGLLATLPSAPNREVSPNLKAKAQGEGGQKKTPPCTAGLPEVAKQNWPEAQSSTTPSGTKIRTDEPFTQAIPHDKICTPTTPPDGEGR